MAYFFMTDDNRVFAGGYNYSGNTGTNTSGGISTYNYSLYPPQEIIYETPDGTIIDPLNIKCISSGSGATNTGTLLLTNDGDVFTTGSLYINGTGSGSANNSKVFKKLLVDANGNNIPKIVDVFTNYLVGFLLDEDGNVLSCGENNGRVETIHYYYDYIKTDIEGNEIPPIKDISTHLGHTILLTTEGEVYTFGKASSNGIYGDGNFTSHAVYYPIKANVKNIVKVVSSSNGFFCLDKFGDLWVNGYVTGLGYTPYSGQYYDGNSYAPYVNFSKMELNELYMQINGDSNKYTLPKKITNIIQFGNYPIIEYIDENNNVNLLTINGFQKYLGAGTTPSSNKYWYNSSGSTGFWDFENQYNGIYNFDNNGIASLTKDGKLHVAGGKGTVGGTADKFTAPVTLPGTEELTIVKVFGGSVPPILKKELYPMPDITTPKIKIRTMV